MGGWCVQFLSVAYSPGPIEKAGDAEERFMELANLGKDPSDLSREPDVPVGLKVICLLPLSQVLDLQHFIPESGSYVLRERVSSGRSASPRLDTYLNTF